MVYKKNVWPQYQTKTNSEANFLLEQKSTYLYNIAYLVGHKSSAEETHLYDTFLICYF